MYSKRFKNKKRNRFTRKIKHKNHSGGKKWIAAINKAKQTLETTGSISKAKKSFRKQAITNVRKLFGSVSSV